MFIIFGNTVKVNREHSFTLITVSAKIRTLYFLFSSVFNDSLEDTDVYTVVYDCRSQKSVMISILC